MEDYDTCFYDVNFIKSECIFSKQPKECLEQHQEDLINRQDNLPLIEEATEREPCGSRILKILIIN
jgi:hypothetical protein